MNLTTLPKVTTTKKRRLGQGHGSGRVKTAGRGTKGQQARHNIPLFFEGGALPLIKRLPFMRGKDRNFSFNAEPVVINVEKLNKLPAKTVVDIETLVKHNIVVAKEAKKKGVKILGNGTLSTALEVKLPVSKAAKEKIEKAGGSISVSL